MTHEHAVTDEQAARVTVLQRARNQAIGFLFTVLVDENAPDTRRAEAAEVLQCYFRATLVKMPQRMQ